MKRMLRNKSILTRYTEQIDIEIVYVPSIAASTFSFDPNSPEYSSFIESMVATFMIAGYELSNNPDWTHKSNKGSESWYYTFLKVEGDKEVKVVVNVRISDHLPPDRPWATQAELRARYVDQLSHDVATTYNQNEFPYAAAINVIIDGKYLKSYYAAIAYIRKQLREIEEAVAEDNNT